MNRGVLIKIVANSHKTLSHFPSIAPQPYPNHQRNASPYKTQNQL